MRYRVTYRASFDIDIEVESDHEARARAEQYGTLPFIALAGQAIGSQVAWNTIAVLEGDDD